MTAFAHTFPDLNTRDIAVVVAALRKLKNADVINNRAVCTNSNGTFFVEHVTRPLTLWEAAREIIKVQKRSRQK